MKKVLNLAMYLLVASLLFVSCSNDDDDDPSVKVDGIYVLNEGNWGGTGSISTISLSDGYVTNKVYKTANSGVPLGELPQTIAVSNEYILITVTTASGAGRLDIVNKDTFKHVESIEGLSYPREITVVGDMAYVSNGSGANAGDKNEVLVINLTTLKIVKRIEVGAGPEKMVLSGDKLYVANSGGWSNSDKTVSVIDTETNTVVETLEVKNCPKDMVVDANGDVWVYCGGKPSYDNVTYVLLGLAEPGISKISVATNEVTSYELTNISTTGLKNICISKDKKTVYFMSDAVYAMDYKATELPTEKFLDKTFYGIDVNPENGNIWCCNPIYGENGEVLVYNEKAEDVASYEVGINPNSTIFKH